ncbi:MAG TPA: methylated-DNA--[protein]-cysteine S-methyltransferase [Micropepsaceae bacterium]|nr:methylated-DNA--[protein]-cysteine S-methyltransferase [Micropepsaceae bacterium]
MTKQTFVLERIRTPTGPMLLVTDHEHRLRAVNWEDHEERMRRMLQRHHGRDTLELRHTTHSSMARRSLEAYFEGDIDAITGALTATSGTTFQRKVWKALCEISAGRPISYGVLAARIGKPKAVRAVGLAIGANPIAIFVPCHRVVGADNSLTGYGGGLDRKRWLLQHEGVGENMFTAQHG